MAQKDKTLRDLNRKELNLREYLVKEILPDFFKTQYPKLISLLEQYYNFENTNDSPSRLLDELFGIRDITQTDLSLLQYIEDELLLGQSYFQGFVDKRSAIKYSNVLYRSKGTKYSIQQFFRTFFGIDPDIIYTKENVFKIGESRIGPNSQKYITDDKLYQTFALLIKSELPLSEWGEIYKIFVHPAGMYVGGEVQIVTSYDLDFDTQPDAGAQDSAAVVLEQTGILSPVAYNQTTALVPLDSDNTQLVRSYPNRIKDWADSDVTLGNLINQYSDMVEFIEANSPSLDEDSDSDGYTIDLSNDMETIDQEKYYYLDSTDNYYEIDEN